MKKALSLVVAIMAGFVLWSSSVFAAAQLPSTSVWFDPATAVVDAPITLNALVYNNQAATATVTVVFTTDKQTKIGSVTEQVPAQSAKTFSTAWKMPAKSTLVTATVTTAVTASKKSLPALVGPVGSITVGTVTPLITGVAVPSFPGSTQIAAWFAPLFNAVEKFRLQQATYFTRLQESSRNKIGLNPAALPQIFQQPDGTTDSTPSSTSGQAANANTVNMFGSPLDYVTYAYATAFTALFANQMVFYIVLILIILLLLRFIANRIF
jgi:hypothetical protein